ncbi:MAG: hypothetical protein ARM1_0455 [Candidatus Micrarchaeota archaeon]|nr:MAG: hypothetical protein ARM1_0455 [Candidatus Micrarchaeota archaeon]
MDNLLRLRILKKVEYVRVYKIVNSVKGKENLVTRLFMKILGIKENEEGPSLNAE